jgi:hypothetical protein
MLEEELKVGVTPMKKRPKLDVMTPVVLDAGFEVTMAVLKEDLGDGDRLVMSNLKLEWKKVVINLELLVSTVSELRTMVKGLSRRRHAKQ